MFNLHIVQLILCLIYSSVGANSAVAVNTSPIPIQFTTFKPTPSPLPPPKRLIFNNINDGEQNQKYPPNLYTEQIFLPVPLHNYHPDKTHESLGNSQNNKGNFNLFDFSSYIFPPVNKPYISDYGLDQQSKLNIDTSVFLNKTKVEEPQEQEQYTNIYSKFTPRQNYKLPFNFYFDEYQKKNLKEDNDDTEKNIEYVDDAEELTPEEKKRKSKKDDEDEKDEKDERDEKDYSDEKDDDDYTQNERYSYLELEEETTTNPPVTHRPKHIYQPIISEPKEVILKRPTNIVQEQLRKQNRYRFTPSITTTTAKITTAETITEIPTTYSYQPKTIKSSSTTTIKPQYYFKIITNPPPPTFKQTHTQPTLPYKDYDDTTTVAYNPHAYNNYEDTTTIQPKSYANYDPTTTQQTLLYNNYEETPTQQTPSYKNYEQIPTQTSPPFKVYEQSHTQQPPPFKIYELSSTPLSFKFFEQSSTQPTFKIYEKTPSPPNFKIIEQEKETSYNPIPIAEALQFDKSLPIGLDYFDFINRQKKPTFVFLKTPVKLNEQNSIPSTEKPFRIVARNSDNQKFQIEALDDDEVAENNESVEAINHDSLQKLISIYNPQSTTTTTENYYNIKKLPTSQYQKQYELLTQKNKQSQPDNENKFDFIPLQQNQNLYQQNLYYSSSPQSTQKPNVQNNKKNAKQLYATEAEGLNQDPETIPRPFRKLKSKPEIQRADFKYYTTYKRKRNTGPSPNPPEYKSDDRNFKLDRDGKIYSSKYLNPHYDDLGVRKSSEYISNQAFIPEKLPEKLLSITDSEYQPSAANDFETVNIENEQTKNTRNKQQPKTNPNNERKVLDEVKYFQDIFSAQLTPFDFEFGHISENPDGWEERYERKDMKKERHQGKVKWGDKKGGYGEHYWDLNHHNTDDSGKNNPN